MYYTQLRALPRRVRRALQRQWRLPLAGVALLLALGQRPGLAATIPVNASCTLVDAITAANTDTATGGCPAGSGADTIVLPTDSTQTLMEVNNDTYGPTGLPVISSVITIEGQGSTIARESYAPEFRLVAVSSTGDLTLNETTVRGGYTYGDAGGGVLNSGTLTVTNSTITGNGTYCSSGGGVANSGTFIVTNSTIAGNNTNDCGAGGPGGGGVDNSGTATITNSTIAGNNGGYGPGGGVMNFGTLTLTNSTISGNGTSGEGGGPGGVANYGTATITNSTIAGNYAGGGGGGVDNSGTLTLTNSTISGNLAGGEGGGAGGGVSNSGTLTILNSTIAGNSATGGSFSGPGPGGGVLNSGTLTLTNSTIVGNSAGRGDGVANYGTLTLARTLVSGNTGQEIANAGTVLADNHNLFGVDGAPGVEGFTPGATDIVPAAGVLLPDILNPRLLHFGGPTQTHPLVPGSPAIDAGGPDCLDATGTPLLTDQRGRPRPVDGNGDRTVACDIGAFEFAPVVETTILVNAHCTLVDAITAANTDTATGGCPAGSEVDTIVLPAGSIQTLYEVNNSTYGPTGLPVITGVITIEGQGSTIVRASSAPEFRIMAVTGELTLNETTVRGGVASRDGGEASFRGGGLINFGLFTLTNSTITGNAAHYGGGGVANSGRGTLTITNSTIAGNSTDYGGGGVLNSGTVTITNSTIAGNSAGSGGGVANSGTLTLTRTLVSGNGVEIDNSGTVLADNHNLFGVNGTAGVEGFSPGATDIIPPAGIQLADILDPTLANNGGPTQTHVLVPGSPAIDAGGPACLDASGAPLLTDQRGRPRVVDGNGDGTAACDVGAVEFFPIVNDLVALVGDVDTAFDPTPVAHGPAGTFTVMATFTNTSDAPLRFLFFGVTQLTGDTLVLNADGAPGGVGATVTPEVAGEVLAPGAEVTAAFVIGLQAQAPFTFFVNAFGEPLP
jgi:hypothetical protein